MELCFIKLPTEMIKVKYPSTEILCAFYFYGLIYLFLSDNKTFHSRPQLWRMCVGPGGSLRCAAAPPCGAAGPSSPWAAPSPCGRGLASVRTCPWCGSFPALPVSCAPACCWSPWRWGSAKPWRRFVFPLAAKSHFLVLHFPIFLFTIIILYSVFCCAVISCQGSFSFSSAASSTTINGWHQTHCWESVHNILSHTNQMHSTTLMHH